MFSRDVYVRTNASRSRAVPPATLAHDEEEWNGTDGPKNQVQTGDLQMPRALSMPHPGKEPERLMYVCTYVRTYTPGTRKVLIFSF